jgi:uncharacterized protein YllA (UPF0747 family)
MQDSLLPTAAYVAGPGELAYFAQLGPAYEWASVEMPFIKPRASLSIIDNASLRVMDEKDLAIPDLSEDPDRLFAALVRRTMPPDIAAAFDSARSEANGIIDELKSIATAVEPTLDRSTEAARTRVLKQIDRLFKKVERGERRKHDELRRRLAHAQRMLFPAGGLQERTLSPLYFEVRYGPGFFSRLLDYLSLDTTEHQVVRASDV